MEKDFSMKWGVKVGQPLPHSNSPFTELQEHLHHKLTKDFLEVTPQKTEPSKQVSKSPFFLNQVNLKRGEWQHRNVHTFSRYFQSS